MRLGVLEFIVIIGVFFGTALAIRIFRGNLDTDEQKSKSSEEITCLATKKRPSRANSFPIIAGFVFVIAGTLLAFAGMRMFKWAVQTYAWSFIVLGIGLTILLYSRNK